MFWLMESASGWVSHNGWLLLIGFGVPLFLFSGLRSPGWMLCRIVIATIVGWVLLNLAADRYWDWRIETLRPDATEEQMRDATADGANRVFTLILGWIPTGLYATLWGAAWFLVWFLRRRLCSPGDTQ